MKGPKFLAVLIGGLAVSVLQAAPLLVNGSLTGPIANGGVPTGWTILAGSPDTMNQNNNVGVLGATNTFVVAPSGPSPDGGTWVGLGRDGSFIEEFGQTLTGFTTGNQYAVSWYLGNFGYNEASPPYGGDNGIELLLDGVSVASSALISAGPNWTAQSMTFTATSDSLQMAFQLVSGNKSYLSIDGIALADANSGVPEPATSTMMAAGLAVAAILGRKRLARRHI